MTMVRTITPPITLFSNDPRVIRFPLLDADGEPQDLIGRAFLFVARRTVARLAIIEVEMLLSGDGLYAIAPITAEQAETLFEASADLSLSYDVIEVTGGASLTRWTGRLQMVPSTDVSGDAEPVWLDLPYAQILSEDDTIAISENGAQGHSASRQMRDAGLISADTVDAVHGLYSSAVDRTVGYGKINPGRIYRKKLKAVLPFKFVDYDTVISSCGYNYLYPQGACVEGGELFILYLSHGGTSGIGWNWVAVYDWATCEYKHCFSCSSFIGEGGCGITSDGGARYFLGRDTATSVSYFDITSVVNLSRLTATRTEEVERTLQVSVSRNIAITSDRSSSLATVVRRNRYKLWDIGTTPWTDIGRVAFPFNDIGQYGDSTETSTVARPLPKTQGIAFGEGWYAHGMGGNYVKGAVVYPYNLWGIRLFSDTMTKLADGLVNPSSAINILEDDGVVCTRLESEGAFVAEDGLLYSLNVTQTYGDAGANTGGLVILQEMSDHADALDFASAAATHAHPDRALYIAQFPNSNNKLINPYSLTGAEIATMEHMCDFLLDADLPRTQWYSSTIPAFTDIGGATYAAGQRIVVHNLNNSSFVVEVTPVSTNLSSRYFITGPAGARTSTPISGPYLMTTGAEVTLQRTNVLSIGGSVLTSTAQTARSNTVVTTHISESNTASAAPYILSLKGRAFGAAVQNGDLLGTYAFGASDGTNYRVGAGFQSVATAAAATGAITANLTVWTNNGSTGPTRRWDWDANGDFHPFTDNVTNLGTGAYRMKEIFSGNAVINTSDARLKRDIGPVSDALLDAWGNSQWCCYRWIEAFEEKGDAARWHFGLIAQQVRDVIDAGLGDGAALRLGAVCHDSWDAQEEVLAPVMERAVVGRRLIDIIDSDDPDEPPQNIYEDVWDDVPSGDMYVVQPARDAGERWGLRYSQCFALEAAWVRRQLASVAAWQAAIEHRVLALEGRP